MNSFPMVRRCKEAQWRGFTPGEQEWMRTARAPTFISLGHRQVSLWSVEHANGNGIFHPQRSGDFLITIKYDCWPEECERGRKD